MTVRITGPWCSRCSTFPAQADGLCSACERLQRLFGPSESRLITSVNDPGFERALDMWRRGP